MEIKLRRGVAADADSCGRICYSAFKTISEAHNFAPDFPSPDIAIGLLTWMLSHPEFYSIIAEIDGRIVGSNFLDERNAIRGLGPITVDPAAQNRAVGRRLMEAAHERAAEMNAPGIRLVQAGFHTRSLSLYTKLDTTSGNIWPACKERLSRQRSPDARCGKRPSQMSRRAIVFAKKSTGMIAAAS